LIFAANNNRPGGGINLSESEEAELKTAFDKAFENGKPTNTAVLADAIVRKINRKAGISWSSGNHTALPVITAAQGPQSIHFSKKMDNTDIGKRLKHTVQ